MPGVEDDLQLLLDAVQSAGQVALAHSEGPLDITDKPQNAGPVTQADIAVNDRLSSILRPARPSYGWLSEESVDTASRAEAETLFIIDPIDGTRSYIDRSRTWAISVAIVRLGAPVVGVVHMPARGLTFAATSGGGATLNGAPITSAPLDHGLDDAQILATRPSLEPHHWQGDVPRLTRAHRPSLAYRLCLVAQGRFDGMFTFRPSWEWDIAAGSLICSEAGVSVSDGVGGPLVFNNPHPQTPGIIAAPSRIWAEIVARRPTSGT